MSILPLNDAVRAQIRSSVEITSLADVVEELVKNSLDATATAVEIDVDFARGFCSVQDDGVGIPSTEFSHQANLARPNCTSKLNALHTYGFRGCFLASLSSLSLTSISSKQQGAQSASSAILGHSSVLSRLPHTDDDEPRAHGTKVTVNNLFGNIPVRFKHLASSYHAPKEEEKAFDSLKKLLVGYLLASAKPLKLRLRTRNRRLKYTHRPLHISLPTATSAFELSIIENILTQANFTNPSLSAAWKLASAKAGPLSIRAAICTLPAPSKQTQFVALGHTPLSASGVASLLYEAINTVFDSSNFGLLNDTGTLSPDATTGPYTALNQSSLSGRPVKAVDRWPRFFIRIDTKSITTLNDMQREPGTHESVSPVLQSILDLLKALLIRFLQGRHLKPKSHRPSKATDTLKPDREARSSSQSVYRSWKRVKLPPGRKRDTQDGLPFTTQDEPPISEIGLGSDVRLLLGDLDLDLDPELTDESNDESDRLSNHFTCHQRILSSKRAVSWINPHSGQLVQVDPNNGFILPYYPSLDHTAKGDDAKQLTEGQSFTRLINTLSTRAELVQRLKKWPSAAFQSTSEQSIPSAVLCDESTACSANTSSDSIVDQNLDVDQLANAVVLGQVDAKYILVVATTKRSPTLILIDQHAADERVKVEGLFQQLNMPHALTLAKRIKFEVTAQERRMLEQRRETFAAWGITYDATGDDGTTQVPNSVPIVTITHVPAIISERCRLEPKLLIELLRKEIWSPSTSRRTTSTKHDQSWLSKMSWCPEGLVEMVNSRACRTAIMFNDHLSQRQCENLVKQLSRCVLPFQCAHGRPSLVVVGHVGGEFGIGIDLWTSPKRKASEDFGNAFRNWCGLDTAE